MNIKRGIAALAVLAMSVTMLAAWITPDFLRTFGFRV